uniref:Uncharacterized protein n=1 Tax=Rhizophagus irregularis (strain DAOM 181602 / DAOM 197198 / MUCL 43194) TaxID=747089 RepID=U9U188_RHIID
MPVLNFNSAILTAPINAEKWKEIHRSQMFNSVLIITLLVVKEYGIVDHPMGR